MLKPEITIGDTTIELPCALKDIENITIREKEIFEFSPDGIDALSVNIYWGGKLAAVVSLDNRDKDVPLEEKTIIEFSFFGNTEIYGIRKYESKWEDACEIFGESKAYYNFCAPLEKGYYLDCRRRYGQEMVTEMSVYKSFKCDEN